MRLGGLGISIYSEACVTEFSNSRILTRKLISKIVAQDNNFMDETIKVNHTNSSLKAEKAKADKIILNELRTRMNKEQLKANDIAHLKGASAWLTALPINDEGFVLNKREFFDAVALRYRWSLLRLPQFCACGKHFDMDHAMSCMKGGYVHKRHDRIRDLFTKVMVDIAQRVRTEPTLTPLTGEVLPISANTNDGARVNIAARDFWVKDEMAFFLY